MNEQGKKLVEIIERAVECRFYSSEKTFQPCNYGSGWLTRPYAVVTQLLKGRVEIILRGKDKIIRTPGKTLYIPAGTWRKTFVLSREGAQFIWARASFTVFSGIDVLSFFDIPVIFGKNTQEPFYSILNQLSELTVCAGQSVSVFEMAAKRQRTLYELLSLIMSKSRIREGALYTLSRINRLSPALDYINENFRRNIAVDELAEMAYLSKSQFHRNFKRAFNVSPLEYQKNLRLKEAQKFLTLSDLSIAEISEKTGYGDQFHFSRIFKKHFGMSPFRYRQSNSVDRMGI